MSKIIITDGQTDDILATIWKKDVTVNEHEEDKPTLLNKLEFTAYADRPYAKHLHGLNRLLIMDEDGKWIELVIARAFRYSANGEYKIDVIALASYLQVKKAKVIKPHKTAAQSAEAHMRQIFAETEIEVGHVVHTGTESIEYENITNPFNAAKVIANQFKLELQYRVEADEHKITRRFVDLVGQVGEWRGRQVEFGRDLIKIERIEDTSEIYTAVHAFGPEQEDGNRLEVIVEDQDALQRWGRDKHLVYVYEPESTDQDMTLDRLRQLARTKLDELIVAFISYEGDIIDLEGMPGLENKKVRIGDSIYIKDTKFEPPLYVEARIFNQKRDIFVKTKKVVKLGDYKEYSVEETHAIWKDLQHEIEGRLKKILLVTITSDAGTIFKNGQGETTLTANLFASGHETDINGTAYTYKWSKTNLLWEVEFAEGKEVTVTAADVSIATIFLVEVIKNGTVMTKAQITVTNVDDGKDGAKGEKGDPGVPGVPGPPGENGQALYTWVKYATDDKGSNMSDLPAGRSHIGFAYNKPTKNESTNPSDYEWAKIEGDQGTKGADGETYYTWLKYADTPTSGMSDSPAGKLYMGLAYNKTSPNESTNYADYSWSLIKGEKGDKGDRGLQGIQGPPGTNGQSQYMHIRYSVNANGNPMTSSPQSNSKYIGLANTTSATAPSSYTSYTWALIKGDDGQDGIQGPPGKNGQPTYTWVKYADDENGSGMSDSPGDKLYIGFAFNKSTATESSNAGDYAWSLMPQNIDISEINLIPNSDEKVTTSSYRVKEYFINEDFIQGEKYTVVLKGSIASGQRFGLYQNVGSNNRGYFESLGNGIFRLTFTSLATTAGNERRIRIYNVPDDSSKSATIEWIKFVRGNKTSLSWQPAPEDVQAGIDEAKGIAENAQKSADGKNTVFYQSSQPSTSGRMIGDVWFNTGDGYRMYRFNGTSWVATQFGNNALANLSITNAKIANGTIDSAKISTVDAGKVTAGHMSFDRLQGGSAVLGGSGNFGNLEVLADDDSTIFKANKDGLVDAQGRELVGKGGVLSQLTFVSSGGINGWQQAGWWGEGTISEQRAYIYGYIPPNFEIESATLYTYSRPLRFRGWSGISDGYYHCPYIHLITYNDYRDAYLDFPAQSEYTNMYRTGTEQILSGASWGGSWHPSGSKDQVITASVTNRLQGGYPFVFGVKTTAPFAQTNKSLILFQLSVTGYKK